MSAGCSPAPPLAAVGPGGRGALTVHVTGEPGSYLLTEQPEAVGMAEVLPGVENLEEGMGERGWAWRPCPPPSRPISSSQA